MVLSMLRGLISATMREICALRSDVPRLGEGRRGGVRFAGPADDCSDWVLFETCCCAGAKGTIANRIESNRQAETKSIVRSLDFGIKWHLDNSMFCDWDETVPTQRF